MFTKSELDLIVRIVSSHMFEYPVGHEPDDEIALLNRALEEREITGQNHTTAGMLRAARILEICGWNGAGPNPSRIIRERAYTDYD